MEKPATPFAGARSLILKLRDVSSCEIQLTPAGEIAAVHVTARPGRTPKQIARDIEAILAAEGGIYLDHRKISIAQYGEEEEAAGAPTLARISVGNVTLHQGAAGFEAEVTLAAGPVQARGRAAGASSRYETRRVIAHATLDAVAKLARNDPALTLGELEERQVGTRRVLIACVNRQEGRSETSLVGCCEISFDPTLSVIYAVLDAINRVAGTLAPREPVEYEIGPAPTEYGMDRGPS
jgi:hypothetical protein